MSAIISSCSRYRYRLGRDWPHVGSRGADRVAFVMLNPSTADAELNDPTIRRCIGFARSWGFGGLDVVNLFAWRATDPSKLIPASAQGESVGPDNDQHIVEVCSAATMVIAAWGNGPKTALGSRILRARAAAVTGLIRGAGRNLHHLGPLTAIGNPQHPLYLAGSLQPQPMESASA